MRRLIVQEFVTVDGLAAGPNDEVDFIPAATVGDSDVLGSFDMELLEAKTSHRGATLLRYRPR